MTGRPPLRRALLTLEFMPSPGGIERLLHERARSWEPRSLTVVTEMVPGWEAFDSAQAYRVRRVRNPFAALPPLRRLGQVMCPLAVLPRLHRRERFDVVECGQAFPYPLALALARRLGGPPYVVWVHGNDLLAPLRVPLLGGLLRHALRGAALVVANSTFTAGLVRGAGVDDGRIRVLKRAVDSARFRPAPAPERLRRRYGLEGRRVLLTVGRLVERKGVDTVIRALPAIAARHPGVRYLVVGSGPMERRLRLLAGELGQGDRVIFAGAVAEEEIPLHYHLADLFVMASRHIREKASVEGLGLVYLEAGACGLPVVAGRSGGVPDVVADGVNGLLVDPESPEEVAAAVVRVLDDPALAAALGREGRRMAERPTEWEILDLPG